MAGTKIGPVSESAFALMERDEEEKASVEAMAERFRGATNWFARKKLFLELLDELDTTSDLAAELADSPEFAELFDEAAKSPEFQAALAEAQEALRNAGGEAAEVTSTEDDVEDGASEDLLPEDPFAIVVPIYVGAILERLAEPWIDCVEQAAFYLLSTHEEHQEAATEWIDADPKRQRLFKKFVKANPAYQDALERVMENGVEILGEEET